MAFRLRRSEAFWPAQRVMVTSAFEGFATRGDVAAAASKPWAESMLRLVGPSSYSARRGHLYVLGKGGEIGVVDVKEERRRSRDCGSERGEAEGAGPSFEVNAGECAMRFAPGKGFPEGFLATALEASPVSSPYEQRLAIGGLSRGDGSAGASTAIFLASVNPRNSRRRVVADASGGSEEAGKYSVFTVHDNLQGCEHLNALKFAWHPGSANHLVVLLENPLTHESFLHVYDVSGEEGGNAVAQPEQAYCLRASGQGLGFGMVKVKKEHRFVDFAFGPMSGWASRAIFLAARSGEVYCLCPLGPLGLGSGPNKTINAAGAEDSPDREPSEAVERGVTVPQLYGPLEVCGSGSAGGEESPATAVSCVSAGSNCVVLLTSFACGLVKSHVVMGDLWPEPNARGACEDLLRVSASLNAVDCPELQLLQVDRLEAAAGGLVVADPIEPESFFLVQESAVFRVSLCWMRTLSQWLLDLLGEEGEDAKDLSMPPPVVSKIFSAAGGDIAFGEMIANRIDPHVAFGLSGGRIRVLQVQEDLDVEPTQNLRPAVEFDIGSLDCSTTEIDGWYASLPLSDSDAIARLGSRKKGSQQADEVMHEGLSCLKEGYIERLQRVAGDLTARLDLLRDSGGKEAARAEDIEKSVRLLGGVEANRGKIAEAVERQRELVEKAKRVGELITASQARLSTTEVSFSEELRGMEGACAQLEERIGKIKDGAQKVMAQKGHNSVSQYIRQLPKVRSILEEDAATVQMNIAKIMEIKQSLDAL